MATIDIPVPDALAKVLKPVDCASLMLPQPSPLNIKLPGGATLSAFSDISKGFPSDCSLTFSLMVQVAPFLAATQCVVKVLKFVQTVLDVVKSAANPIDLVAAIPKIVKAGEPVVECALSFTPAGLIPFIRDLLCLIIKILNCFLSQMKSVINILTATSLQLTIAQQSSNDDLIASLQCSQANAMTQAQHLTASLEAVGIILSLASDLMEIVGVKPIQLPTLGSQADVDSLNQVVQTVQQLVATVQTAVDLLGGCD